MKISLIIPALDEEQSLPGVLARVPPGAVDQVIVVDNGSTDRTGEVARRAGATVVTEATRGYGSACWAGCAAAGDSTILVFMDGDGSFEPAEIDRLTDPIARGEADLVLGSRTAGAEDASAIPLHARLGNGLIASVIRHGSGIPLTDLGPFRAIRRETLQHLDMRERTYGWPCEMIVKAGKSGYRVTEVPVTYRPRTGGTSKVSGSIAGSVRAAIAMLRVTLRWSFGDLRSNASR